MSTTHRIVAALLTLSRDARALAEVLAGAAPDVQLSPAEAGQVLGRLAAAGKLLAGAGDQLGAATDPQRPAGGATTLPQDAAGDALTAPPSSRRRRLY